MSPGSERVTAYRRASLHKPELSQRYNKHVEILLVLTNLPDVTSAQTLAISLVDQHLAACANVMSPCQSVYRWQGKLENSEEIPLLIKTTRDRYAALESAIRVLHPYELPEIIAVPVVAGLPAYLDWVTQECN